MSANKNQGSDYMQLNERKVKILQAIITDYVDTAEPVGSRTISKKYDLGVSSATIRNEMADLEDLGLIQQPHASAGRVPSDRGYRLYVDEFLELPALKAEQLFSIQQLIKTKITEIDILMKQVAQLISALTNYTSMVSSPQMSRTKIKHIQILPIDSNSVLMVLVTNENIVKNKVIHISNSIPQNSFEEISKMINKKIGGLTLEEIHLPLILEIQKELGKDEEILSAILREMTEIIQSIDQQKIYMGGTTNLLNHPEFNNIEKAKVLLNMFEDIGHMNRVVEINDVGKMNISIGKENEDQLLQDCSIIKATYSLGDQVVGTIGVLGPTRMDYSKTIAVVETMAKDLNQILIRMSTGS